MARPGTFKPGQSGNPSGRPRVKVDIQWLARQYTPAALEALAEALKSPKERVAAATVLLDRAWGRPPQTVAVDPASPPATVLHLIAAKVTSRELLEQRTISLDPAAVAAEPQQPFDLLSAAPPLE